jgi:hypothetical protein
MTKHTGSAASPEHSWLKLYAAVAALPLALVACGGGGGGGTPAPPQSPPPAPAPAAMLTVTASATTTTPGGASIALNATVTNSSDTPTWTLNGPGSLSAASGTSINYIPPATGSLGANATAIVSAALTGATTQTVTIALTVPSVVAGLNWSNVTVASIGNLQGVDYADNHYVAVSDVGTALASTDGATWSPITLFTPNSGTDHLDAHAIAHIGGTYVAVGSVSVLPYTSTTGTAAVSSDGVTWTMASTLALDTPLHGVIGGARFVGLGETGHLYSSTDGHTWISITTIPGVQTLNAGVYGNGKYIAVGDAGYIIASSDSIAWLAGQVVKSAGVGVNLHGVTWTGSQYVAVGDNGNIATSPDGAAWTPRTSALTGALRSVAATPGGEIVVVGDAGIETSEDGITWTTRDEAGAAALLGVTYANGEFVAVGVASAIKTSTSN